VGFNELGIKNPGRFVEYELHDSVDGIASWSMNSMVGFERICAVGYKHHDRFREDFMPWSMNSIVSSERIELHVWVRQKII
jgi:hypothetical protein